MLRPTSGVRRIDALDTLVAKRYGITGSILEDFKDLIELRNELTHPVHLPTGTPDNWPDYLRRIKSLGLLNTTGRTDGDYDLLAQVASHRLFRWAFGVVKAVFQAIVSSDPQRVLQFQDLLKNLEAPWFPTTDDDEGMGALLKMV